MTDLIVVAVSISPFILWGVTVGLLDFRDARRERRQRERRYAAQARRDRWDDTRRNIIRLERELGLRDD